MSGSVLFPGDGPVVVGHRGARRRASENTPAAFDAAAELGASWVELDVRLSSDDVAVVVHDAELADGRAVCETTATALSGAGVSTLDDILRGLPAGLGADVEIKHRRGEPGWDAEASVARATARVVTRAAQQHERPLLVTSFDAEAVAVVIADAPAVATGLLTPVLTPVATGLARARELGVDVLAPHYTASGLSREGVAAVHDHGFEVLVWTVNGARRLRRLAAAGVDAVCTDEVELAVRTLRAPTHDGHADVAVAQRSSSSQSAQASRSSSDAASPAPASWGPDAGASSEGLRPPGGRRRSSGRRFGGRPGR